MSPLSQPLDKKPDDSTRLERYLDGLTTLNVDKIAFRPEGASSVSYAQAMSIFEFSRVFTKGLKAFFEEAPEPIKVSIILQHDRLFAETVAYYYYVLMREFLAQTHVDEVNIDDHYNYEFDYEYGYEFYEPKSKSAPADPYFEGLKVSSDLANEIITKTSDLGIPKTFINKRVLFYSYIFSKKDDNVVDVFHRFILKAWNPKSPSLDVEVSKLHIPLMTRINAMPINEVRNICRGLHDELSKNQHS